MTGYAWPSAGRAASTWASHGLTGAAVAAPAIANAPAIKKALISRYMVVSNSGYCDHAGFVSRRLFRG